MAKKIQTFYFDEAGFTGNNLLDPAQPVFVYAGVAIDEGHASRIHSEALSRFQINAQELKHKNLIRHKRGRKAISWILDQSSSYSRVMAADKEYALAGRFFEYIFEPVLASHNSLFYAIDFHKFIATNLYIFARAGDTHVKEALRSFSEMMRSMDPAQLESVLFHLDYEEESGLMGKILAFALCHRKVIESEISRMAGASYAEADWRLELSMTALHWLLASWGEEYEVLDVFCDKSKPIQEAQWLFEAFIGREDKAYIQLGNQRSPSIIYNLLRPINLVDSKESHGVQIADILSSSLAYAYKNPDDDLSKEWLKIIEDVPSNAIRPDPSLTDLMQEGTLVNATVLYELVHRSIMGQDLFANMTEIILNAKSLYPQYLLDMTAKGN